MAWLVRAHPETPCQPEGKHHPHRWVCGDDECDCWRDTGEIFSTLDCCICNVQWPCSYIRTKHDARNKR